MAKKGNRIGNQIDENSTKPEVQGSQDGLQGTCREKYTQMEPIPSIPSKYKIQLPNPIIGKGVRKVTIRVRGFWKNIISYFDSTNASVFSEKNHW